MTLRDFKIESYELIQAQRKPFVSISRVPLTNKNKELVPEARQIIESWFEKWSDGTGYMTPETCVGFIRSTTSD